MTAKTLLCDSYYCRLCCEENKNGTNLFSDFENFGKLSELVNKYLPIKVEDNNKYPKTICPGCHIQLEATKLFLDLIIEGQAKLRGLYQTQQDTLQKQQRQKQKLQSALKNVNPNSSVETFTIETNATGDKYLIQIFSHGPLFPNEHELSLRAEGLEKPRRKRGRPPKKPNTSAAKEIEVEPEGHDVEKPEEAEEEAKGFDGRKRRRIKTPARYQGVVQGAEMDKILKEEGALDSDEFVLDSPLMEHEKDVIGRIETINGEDLGEVVLTSKSRSLSKHNNQPYKKKIPRKYECDACKKEFLHPGRLAIHRNSHKIIYKCETSDCDYKNDHKEMIETHHKETNHTGIMSLENINRVGTIDLSEVDEDIDVTTVPRNIEVFNCGECDKKFSCKQNLSVHIRSIHNGEKPFACDICHQNFAYANALKVHKLKHQQKKSGGDGNGGIDNDKLSRKFTCEICGKVLGHPSSLLYHRESEHNNGRRFTCSTCNRSFKHRQLLQRHQLVHSTARPFICKVCQECFKTRANLMNHQSVHNGIKKFCCNICGHKFAHRTSLTLHQRWHQGEKPYKCDICHKAFSQKGNLNEHKRIHTGEKPYCCEQCGRSFTTSSQFKLHSKRHSGERPWSCHYCPRRFLHKDTFKAHMRRHVGDRPHKCSNCPREFAEKWELKRHERVHSGEKPYSCSVCDRTFADVSNRKKHMRTHNIVNTNSSGILENNIEKKSNEKVRRSNVIKPKAVPTENNQGIEFSQLVDETGNPISIKLDGGYTIPVVTSDAKKTIHGLMPDGTLIPIDVGELTDKDQVVEEVVINNGELLDLGEDISQINGINIIKNEDPSLGTNLQLLTDDDDETTGMCLLAYSVDGQQLGLETFLMDSVKKTA